MNSPVSDAVDELKVTAERVLLASETMVESVTPEGEVFPATAIVISSVVLIWSLIVPFDPMKSMAGVTLLLSAPLVVIASALELTSLFIVVVDINREDTRLAVGSEALLC